MSGRLLKVCAAVVLIAGAGDVMCQGTGDVMELESAPNQSPKKRKIEVTGWNDWKGWRDSVSANVQGEIHAIVKVRSGENEKELKLFEVDGTETSEEDRTFKFEVLVLGTGGTVTVVGGSGMAYDNEGVWRIFPQGYGAANQSEESFINVQLSMYNASGNRVELDSRNSARVSGGNLSETWKIVLEPLPVSMNSFGKKYVGSLNVVVSANG